MHWRLQRNEMKHPYADILIAIAEGKEIQWNKSQGGWDTQSAEDTLHEIIHGEYSPERYRIKPDTILINGVECDAPVVSGHHFIKIERDDERGFAVVFAASAARDAAYAALIKPFAAAIGEAL